MLKNMLKNWCCSMRQPVPWEIETVDVQLGWASDLDEQNSVSVSDVSPKDEKDVSRVLLRWEQLVEGLCEDGWSRINRRQKKLPIHIRDIYERIENSEGIKFESGDRFRFYKGFTKASSCFRTISDVDTLNPAEIEFLIQVNLGMNIDEYVLRDLIAIKLEQPSHNLKDRFDFQLFVSLISDVIKFKQDSAKPPAFRIHWKLIQLPIDPDSEGKQLWDLLILLLLLLCSFYIPYTIAFVSTNEPEALQIVGILIDSLFLFDMVLSFVTAYDEMGLFIRDQRKISVHYLQTWFLPDLAGSFPFDRVISLAAQNQTGLKATNLFRVLRFIRMLKLFRALKLINKLNKLKQKEGFEHFNNIIGISTSGFLLLFVAHTLGCIFAFLVEDGSSVNWLLHYRPELVEAENWVRYVTALYWAIITINTTGYGDIVPVTATERLFTIVVALIGAVVFSYCVGTIALLASQYSTADTRFQEKLRSVFEYLQFREISAELKRKIRSHYCLSYRGSPDLFEESKILEALSEPMRAEVMSAVGKDVVSSLPIFQGCGDECIGLIVSLLKISNFIPGQRIYSQGDRGSDMYIITKGRVRLESAHVRRTSMRRLSSCTNLTNIRIVNGKRENRVVVAKGDVFGEPGLFPELLSGLRPESAVAETWTRAYSLSEHAMRDIQEVYPDVYSRFKDFCELRALESGIAAEQSGIEPLCRSRDREEGVYNKLELALSQMQLHLLHLSESIMLKPAGGNDGSDIMHLFLLSSSSNKVGEICWKSISCVLSEEGEFLYIHHQLEDFDLTSPRSLGFLLPGRSLAHRLLQDDIIKFGHGRSLKQPLGFNLLLFPTGCLAGSGDGNACSEQPVNGADCFRLQSTCHGQHVVVCASSQNEFAVLCENLSTWCEVRSMLPSQALQCVEDTDTTRVICDDHRHYSQSEHMVNQNDRISLSLEAGTSLQIDSSVSGPTQSSFMTIPPTSDLKCWRLRVQKLRDERFWLQSAILHSELIYLQNLSRSGKTSLDNSLQKDLNPELFQIGFTKSMSVIFYEPLLVQKTTELSVINNLESLGNIPRRLLNQPYTRIYSAMAEVNGLKSRISSAITYLDQT